MTIRSLPLIVDAQGFRRKAWEFDYKGHTYYIQETNGPYAVFRRADDETWTPITGGEQQIIVAAFEYEDGGQAQRAE